MSFDPQSYLAHLQDVAVPVLKWYYSEEPRFRGTGRTLAAARALYECVLAHPGHAYEIRDHMDIRQRESDGVARFRSALSPEELSNVEFLAKGQIRGTTVFNKSVEREMLELYTNTIQVALKAGVPLAKLQRALDEATIQDVMES